MQDEGEIFQQEIPEVFGDKRQNSELDVGDINMMNTKQYRWYCIIVASLVCTGCSKKKTLDESKPPIDQQSVVQDVAVDPSQVVMNCLIRIEEKNGTYFSNVFTILETEGAISVLIDLLESPDEDSASQAWVILSRSCNRLDRHDPEAEPRNKTYWLKWWRSAGSEMSAGTMKHNFDSHWK